MIILSGGELHRSPNPKLQGPPAVSGQFSATSLRVFMLEVVVNFLDLSSRSINSMRHLLSHIAVSHGPNPKAQTSLCPFKLLTLKP